MEVEILGYYYGEDSTSPFMEMFNHGHHTYIQHNPLEHYGYCVSLGPVMESMDGVYQYGQMVTDDDDDEEEDESMHENLEFHSSDILDDMDYASHLMESDESMSFLYDLLSNVVVNFGNIYEQDFEDDEIPPDEDREIVVNTCVYNSLAFGAASCSICITDFNDGDNVCALECKHIFHDECIRMWGKYKPVCAMCRAEIPVKQ